MKKLKPESGIPNELYYTLVSESLNYTDPDAYVSDLALSSIWNDPEDAPIPKERIDMLREIYTATHRTISDIASAAGLSNRQLAFRCAIPQRTVENWSNGDRECPPYVLLLIQEALGIFKR